MKSPSALSSGLESNGQGLATALDDLLSADRAAFGRIEKELCDALGSVRALNLRKCVVEVWRNSSSDQRHRTRDSGKELMFRIAGGAEVPASRISDGVILLLGYLVLMGSTSENRILLLEEPENGIHPTQLGRIAGHLKRLTGAGGRQIVVATHSPYLLDHVPPESVVVMGRQPNGDSRAARLLDIPSAKARLDGGFSLGELWFNVGEEALLDEAERAR